MELKKYPNDQWQENENGTGDIETQMLLIDRRTSLAKIRLHPHSKFQTDEPALWDSHVLCIDGGGFIAVDTEVETLSEGAAVLWPKGARNTMWTENDTMTVMLLEHLHQIVGREPPG